MKKKFPYQSILQFRIIINRLQRMLLLKSGISEQCHGEELKLSQAIAPPPIEEGKTSTSETIVVPFHPNRT